MTWSPRATTCWPHCIGQHHCAGAVEYQHGATGPVLHVVDHHLTKIAGEVVARTMARTLGVPTVIARLNIQYGNNGGWPFYHMEMILAGIPIPVPAGGPARYNPIHEDDIVASIPRLLAAASTPATTVNWCGGEIVSLQEWCGYLGSLIGKEPVFEDSAEALRGNPTDSTRMRELIGGLTVDWRNGIHRMVTKFHPELVGA
ncbi:nucleoside-diphosphate-sugar epimerase [Nocardia sp. GAS34]